MYMEMMQILLDNRLDFEIHAFENILEKDFGFSKEGV